MVTGPGSVIARAAAVVPVVLIIVFVGLLWFAGLFCSDKRRQYVTHISDQVIEAIRDFFGRQLEVVMQDSAPGKGTGGTTRRIVGVGKDFVEAPDKSAGLTRSENSSPEVDGLVGGGRALRTLKGDELSPPL